MILVGTSDYNYQKWKGSSYPKTLPASKRFRYYEDRGSHQMRSSAGPRSFRCWPGSAGVFVYFKHEESVKGPECGRLLKEALSCDR